MDPDKYIQRFKTSPCIMLTLSQSVYSEISPTPAPFSFHVYKSIFQPYNLKNSQFLKRTNIIQQFKSIKDTLIRV